MSIDITALHASVLADLPWHGEPVLRGTLRIDDDSLMVERAGPGARRVAIPLPTISRASVETTLGVLPALHVWHTVAGSEVRSRFEFTADDDEPGDADSPIDLSGRVGPGLARDAAARLEGGLRAISGGLRGGKRAMRQAVEGVARQEEYRVWPAAIAQAQQTLARRSPRASRPTAAPPAPIAPPPSIVPERVDVPAGDARAVFAWFKQDVLAWIAACGARARELGLRNAPVIQPMYPLDSPTCRIVVAGEFSRGKSTVINALFGIHGEIALPTGMTPTTPLACAIRVPNVGETDGATITYRTRRPPQQLSLDEFRAGVRLAEEGSEPPGGDARVDLHLDEARRVEVRITGAYLPAGVEIEDTPGLNEQAGRSAAAVAALGRADLILFVLAADQLLSDLEREVIEGTLAQGHHRNVLFLVNFWDNIEDEGQRAVLRQRAETVLRDFPTPFGGGDPGMPEGPPIFYISALQAARAQRQRKAAPEESGVPQLRIVLRDLLGPQSAALLLRARAGRALRYVELLRRAVSEAGAAAAVAAAGGTGSEDQQGRSYREAGVAASRLLDGLPGTVEGATTPLLAALREQRTPGMQRAAEAIARSGAAPPEWESQALQEARRALGMAARAAVAEYALMAQQAVDLVLAQVRAAFLTRGLSALPLDAHVEPVALPVVEGADATELRSRALQVPDMLQEAYRTSVERLRATLMQEVGAHVAEAIEAARRSSPPPPADGDDLRLRTAGLQVLEEDLLRLQTVVRRCVER